MKKTNLLVLSAAAALFATSCSKDQVSEANPGNAIRFKTFSNVHSKATETTTNNLANFKIYAFTGTAQTSFTPFFSDTYNKVETSFAPAGGTHYWPADGSLNCVFIGHAPANLSTGFSGTPVIDISNPAQAANRQISALEPKQDLADQTDLLVFRNHGTGTDNTSSGVALYMQHALSQIKVQAVNHNTSITVKVKGVKVVAKNKGTLTLPEHSIAALNSPIAQSSWTLAEDASYMSYRASGTEATMSTDPRTPTNLMFAENSNFMLIPQTLTQWDGTASANGSYIAVLCQVSDGTTQLFPSTPGSYGYAAVPINTSWEPGKRYTYTLQFFKDNGGGGIEPPIDPTDPDPAPENPGQPIVGGAIKFTVEVNGWADANGQPAETPMGGGTGA